MKLEAIAILCGCACLPLSRLIVSAAEPEYRWNLPKGFPQPYVPADNPMTAEKVEKLFFNQHLSCFRCHGGFNFSDGTMSAANPERRVEFHNTGLYKAPGLLSYPPPKYRDL